MANRIKASEYNETCATNVTKAQAALLHFASTNLKTGSKDNGVLSNPVVRDYYNQGQQQMEVTPFLVCINFTPMLTFNVTFLFVCEVPLCET
jgi:hypothetical protein